MSLKKLVFILDGSFCFASVASTLRKTGTVVLLGKRPAAESEKSWTQAGEFFLQKNHGGAPLSSQNKHQQ